MPTTKALVVGFTGLPPLLVVGPLAEHFLEGSLMNKHTTRFSHRILSATTSVDPFYIILHKMGQDFLDILHMICVALEVHVLLYVQEVVTQFI